MRHSIADDTNKNVKTGPDILPEPVSFSSVETDIPGQSNNAFTEGNTAVAAPYVWIYKTRADYNNLVPVLMDVSRTRIVSYPAPTDITLSAKPTVLTGGYLLDNRGIGPNVAFLNYTYEEYAALPQVPAYDSLISCITDKYPLTELWNCGRHMRREGFVEEMNKLVVSGFKGCTNLVNTDK